MDDGTTTAAKQSSTATLIAYIALALAWGSSFLLMKVALDEFTPAQVALGIVILSERLSWHEPLGALVVILSVMLVQKRPSTHC